MIYIILRKRDNLNHVLVKKEYSVLVMSNSILLLVIVLLEPEESEEK